MWCVHVHETRRQNIQLLFIASNSVGIHKEPKKSTKKEVNPCNKGKVPMASSVFWVLAVGLWAQAEGAYITVEAGGQITAAQIGSKDPGITAAQVGSGAGP